MQKTIFGRGPVRELVRTHLAPPGPETAPGTRPVLIVEGGPGSGRSAVVDALAGEMHGRLHFARFDVAAVGPRLDDQGLPRESTRPLLAAAACHWGRYCPPYGYLGFPRLAIAFAVMRLHRRNTTPDGMRRAVKREVFRMRRPRAARAVLRAAAAGLAPPQPAVVSRPLPAGRTLDALAHRVRTEHKNWFGEQRGGARHDPIEALVDLNRQAGGGEAAYEQIDRLLWRALLADLRDGFVDRRHHERRSANAVLLLDNAHLEFGRTLLGQLMEVRLARQFPLTVVAAAGPSLCAGWADHVVIRDADQPTAGAAPEAQVLRLRLADLTDREVERVVGAGRRLSQARRIVVAREVHGFTGGHPGATQLLVDTALSAKPGPLTLAAALAAAPVGDARTDGTVERSLSRMMLPGMDAAAVRGLEVCAAARNRSDGEYLVRVPALVRNDRVTTPANLWSHRDRPTPTLVRRLLLRGLDQRPAERDAAYESLIDLGTGHHDDDDAAYYYRLARDDRGQRDIAQVAEGLTAELGWGAKRWVERLTAVARAPRHSDTATMDNAEGAARAVLTEIKLAEQELGRRHSPAFDTIVGLLVRSWIAADPLCGPDRAALHRQLRNGFERMKDYLGDHDEVLQGEIDRHERLAALWAPRLDDDVESGR